MMEVRILNLLNELVPKKDQDKFVEEAVREGLESIRHGLKKA